MFTSRPSWFYGLLIIALAGPYLALDKSLGGGLWPQLAGLWAKPVSLNPPEEAEAHDSAAASHLPGGSKFAVQGATLCSMEEAFRLDLTPQSVVYRWPHAALAPAGTNMQALRVPLVTGTRADDLTGSLTYYFDRQQVLQRILFQGATGDPRRVVAFVSANYGITPAANFETGLSQTHGGDKRASTFRIDCPAATSATQPVRCEVLLDIHPADVWLGGPSRTAPGFSRRINPW